MGKAGAGLLALPLAALLLSAPANASTFTVTVCTDTVSGGAAGTGAGIAGDLRYALLEANAAGGANTIVFNCPLPSTITLGGPLPPIFTTGTANIAAFKLTIDGGQFGDVIIDGAELYRVFFVDNVTVKLANLQIQNANATGGAGGQGEGGGGGGAGFGAGLFVNQATAAVTVSNTYFYDCNVTGAWVATVPLREAMAAVRQGPAQGPRLQAYWPPRPPRWVRSPTSTSVLPRKPCQ